MVSRDAWENGGKRSKDKELTSRPGNFWKYALTAVTAAALSLGSFYWFYNRPELRQGQREKSELVQVVKRVSAARDSLATVVGYSDYNSQEIERFSNQLGLNLGRDLRRTRNSLYVAQEFNKGLKDLAGAYAYKINELETQNNSLGSQKRNLDTDNAALEDSVGVLNYSIDVLSEELHGANSALATYKEIEEANKPQVIKLPGGVSARFNYYLKNGDNAGGLAISKSLGKSNIIDSAIEGGFNVFEGRDTGQFLGFRFSLDLLERFSWDFGMGPYILRDFSDGAKATLTMYGESGFYFEPFGKVKGLGLRVGIRKLEDRVDYSTALELGRR